MSSLIRRNNLQTFFHFGINGFKQIFPRQVGTNRIIREILALPGACLMNGTPLVELSVEKKDTGTVLFNFEGIPFFDISLPYLAITYLKMAGNPVYIDGGNEKRRSRKPITAEAGTVIAESSVCSYIGGRCCALHIFNALLLKICHSVQYPLEGCKKQEI
jgi:hypothetical protein